MPNIYDKIKERVEKLSKENVAKQLGYNSLKHSIKAIDKFLSYDDLYSWLYESGFYDFKYDSKQFLKKICNVVGIDETDIDKEIQKNIALKKEIDKLAHSDPNIYLISPYLILVIQISVKASARSYVVSAIFLPIFLTLFKCKILITKLLRTDNAKAPLLTLH